jgi:hypothetical protein
VGRAKYRKDFFVGGQGNGSAYDGTGTFYGFHDFLRRLINQVVVVGFEFDSDFLAHKERY